MRLESYLAGRWHSGSGASTTLFNPTTEAPMAEVSSGGLDFAAALAWARTTGRAGLAELSFAQRGRLLQAAADAIHAQREPLVELAIAQGGNTRGDAKFDIDGATATLAHYATIGERLGEARFRVEDAEGVQLGRSPRLVGVHLLVPRTGVAVHINAFNFPAWGFAEKAAVALLAGMPVITKPATATALVAERIVRLLVEQSILPAGALSLVCGGVQPLLPLLGGQDVLAFTGSSATASRIRALPNVIAHNLRVNIEADSLNAAVLGPDVAGDAATYDLFIREVARDVTQKAGQKCTAIRRVLVPAERIDDVTADLRQAISDVRVGDPALKEVRMGPLATAAQADDVRAGIGRLATVARAVLGGGGRGTLVGVAEARGYFVAPTLFQATDARAAAIHEHEVFGPVATVMPYASASDASTIVAAGQGGLVASIYSDDRDFVGAMVAGIAPYHGRLHLGSDKIAEHSLGPGTVLPQLVHGGPGRAGGGEELGGERALDFYSQRTAVQGAKPMIEKLLGR